MGLDQFAVVRKPGENEEKNREIAYWRKHNRLQGWMEKLWKEEKGGGGKEFNCVEIELTLEDLKKLEKAIKSKKLPKTTGFFFGDDSYEDYEKNDKETDLKFIKDAKKEIKDGNKVYYSSWW